MDLRIQDGCLRSIPRPDDSEMVVDDNFYIKIHVTSTSDGDK